MVRLGKVKADLIAEDLASKIKYGQFKGGHYLPSENQLVELYGSSRETVRKALGQLNGLGLIQTIKGKGSVVLDLQKYSFPISGITSFAELNRALGMKAETQVLKCTKMNDLPEQFLQKFPEQRGQAGIYVERLRLINERPVVLDCDYLFNPPVLQLPRKAAEQSIYQYLEQELQLDISYATKEITVEQVATPIQKCLQIADSLAVLIASRNYLNDTTLFQLTMSYHNPEKFKFVDFARRQKISL